MVKWYSNDKPDGKKQVLFEIGSSLTLLANNSYKYPNVDIGMKVTKNLSIINKIYGFKTGNEHPQIMEVDFNIISEAVILLIGALLFKELI